MIFTIYLAFASRFHGGGFNTGPAVSLARFLNLFLPARASLKINEESGSVDWPRPLRAAAFAIPYFVFGWPAALAAGIFKNVGHENFWNMGTAPSIPRESWLCKVVLFLGLKYGTLAFETSGMALKGALTAAGTFSPALIAGHAVALPLAYYIGQRTRWGNVCAEYLSGALYGLVFCVKIKMWGF